MKQVVWEEELVETGGCQDPECCGTDYWGWFDQDRNLAYDRDDAARSTAHDLGMKDAYEWMFTREEVEAWLKKSGVELVFIEGVL